MAAIALTVLQRLVAAFALALGLNASAPQNAHFTHVHALQPAEGVFAYSRISPDGNFLAYASLTFDTSKPRPQASENLYALPGASMNAGTVTVVDLRTGKIVFTEPGIDAYWSPDGERMIYFGSSVSIWYRSTGKIARNVAPRNLGDYYSWAVRDGKDLILTISSNYYYLDRDQAVLPHEKVDGCPDVGIGDRPLISKDGQLITTFVRGNIVVRSLTDCQKVFDTGLAGQKADFSYDNRYIAFHAQRPGTRHYDVLVVDLKENTVRNITESLSGSSLFPNWTRNGRLSFRYDSTEYRGFMFASNVLGVPASPLPKSSAPLAADRSWADVFPGTVRPQGAFTMVLIWSSWSAHSPMALREAQKARDYFGHEGFDLNVLASSEPGSHQDDVKVLLSRTGANLPAIQITPAGLALTEGRNQMPTTLLFRGEALIDRRLGAQTFTELREWLMSAGARSKAPLHRERATRVSRRSGAQP